MRFLAVIVAILCLPEWLMAAAPPSLVPIREDLDIRYHVGKERHTLDVFSPAGDLSRRYPVVLFVHGGTWMYGDKNFFGVYRGVGRRLAREGIVAVLINYRLSPVVRHPEHAIDVARAFSWTHRNIGKMGGDPNRIILAGHSAGAHLVSLIATDRQYLEDPSLGLSEEARRSLRGVVAVSGVYRIPGPVEFQAMSTQIVNNLLGSEQGGATSPLLRPVLLWVGKQANPFHLVFGTGSGIERQASPISHVRGNLPPFLILTAQWEVPGLERMAEDFTQRLTQLGNEAKLLPVEDCTHRSIILKLHNPQEKVTQQVLEFVQQHTSGKDSST